MLTWMTDEVWTVVLEVFAASRSRRGDKGRDDRRVLEALHFFTLHNITWRALPAEFGKWNSVYVRFRDWVKADVFARLFEACSDEPDMEYAMVDAPIVKVHRHGQGAKGGLRARPSAAPRAA